MRVGLRLRACALAAASLLLSPSQVAFASGNSTQKGAEIIRLWPGTPPGGSFATTPERTFIEQADWKRQQVTISVSDPSMTVVRPKRGEANGTAVVVAPGGGFVSLVWDLEGTEIADWLATRGVTVFILKYRVSLPGPAEASATEMSQRVALMEPKRKLAVSDAIQAISLIRKNAKEWGIDPNRVGMIGFSAGAMTTMGAVLAEDPAMRPNFAAPIYGGAPSGASASADSPPLFIVHAEDDATVPAASSINIFNIWQAAKRPAELHIYSKGGHGFGMRAQGLPVDGWPSQFENWLGSLKLIKAEAIVPAAVPKDKATTTQESSALSIYRTSIGDLLQNATAKAVIDKHLPGFTQSGALTAARSLTLKEMQSYAPAVLTDERLMAIEDELPKK